MPFFLPKSIQLRILACEFIRILCIGNSIFISYKIPTMQIIYESITIIIFPILYFFFRIYPYVIFQILVEIFHSTIQHTHHNILWLSVMLFQKIQCFLGIHTIDSRILKIRMHPIFEISRIYLFLALCLCKKTKSHYTQGQNDSLHAS